MKITDILDEHGVNHVEHGVHHHVCEGWEGADCPQCSPGSHKYRLGINLTTGAMNCWTCGPLNRVATLAELTGLTKRQCHALIGGMDVAPRTVKKRGKLIPPTGVGPMTKPHLDYLRGRGYDPDEIARLWGVQGTGRISSHPWRLYIPVAQDDEILSWTTRSISQTVEKRYINASPEQECISIKSLLYGQPLARHCAVIVEGPTSAWRVGAGAVATLGMSYTRSQVALLACYARRAIVYDNSPDAQRRARQLAGLLCTLDGDTMIVTLDAEDPGSASKREIRKLRESLEM